MLGRRLGIYQWLSLLILMAGVALVQVISSPEMRQNIHRGIDFRPSLNWDNTYNTPNDHLFVELARGLYLVF